jgi:hypothetical protein
MPSPEPPEVSTPVSKESLPMNKLAVTFSEAYILLETPTSPETFKAEVGVETPIPTFPDV